jgi:hypothetical protein
MTDETNKPGATPATTPKGKAGTELDDAALDRVSGGAPIYVTPVPPTKPVTTPTIEIQHQDWIEM